jgi:hypothetical protein
MRVLRSSRLPHTDAGRSAVAMGHLPPRLQERVARAHELGLEQNYLPGGRGTDPHDFPGCAIPWSFKLIAYDDLARRFLISHGRQLRRA